MRRILAGTAMAAFACLSASLGLAGVSEAQTRRDFTVPFSPNEATLSKEARAVVGVAVELAQDCSSPVVKIVGHDDTAAPDRAQQLALARADAIKKIMMDDGGLNASSFTVEGRGGGEKPDRHVQISVSCK